MEARYVLRFIRVLISSRDFCCCWLLHFLHAFSRHNNISTDNDENNDIMCIAMWLGDWNNSACRVSTIIAVINNKYINTTSRNRN